MSSSNKNLREKNLYSPSFCEQLDIFGLNYTFLIEGNDSIQTFFGSLLTMIYVFLTVGLFFGFGMDLYQRKRPKVSLNNEILEYQKYSLSNQNFSLAFRVEDQLGQMVTDERIIYLEVLFFKFELNEKGTWDFAGGAQLPIKRCYDISEKVALATEKKFNVSLAAWNCIDFSNFTLGGNWDGSFVYGLNINTRQCMKPNNNTDKNANSNPIYNNSAKNCLEDVVMKENFQNVFTGANYFYSYLYMEALPIMDDFENPIKTHLVNKYETLSLKVAKRAIQKYKVVSIDNNNGWMFDDVQRTNYYSSDTIATDFSLKEEFQQDVLYNHMIYFGNKAEIYKRNYTKIQEVIANVGGFTGLFYKFFLIIYSYIGKYLKYDFLFRKFDFEKKDIEKNELIQRYYNKSINNSRSYDIQNSKIFRSFNSQKKKVENLKKCDISNINNINGSNLKNKNKEVLSKNSENKNPLNDYKYKNYFESNFAFPDKKINNFISELSLSANDNENVINDKHDSCSKVKISENQNAITDNNINNNLNDPSFVNGFKESGTNNFVEILNSVDGKPNQKKLNYNPINIHLQKKKAKNLILYKIIISDICSKQKNEFYNNNLFQKKLNIFDYFKNIFDFQVLREILFEEYSKSIYVKNALLQSNEIKNFKNNLKSNENENAGGIYWLQFDHFLFNLFNNININEL